MDRITPQGYDYPRKVNNPFWENNSGSTDYEQLENKPAINGHTLIGDQTSEDLGIQVVEALTTEQLTTLLNIC